MIEIDNKRMWESLYRYGSKYEHFEHAIPDALKEQGLQFKDGKIVSAETEQEAAELTEFEKKIQLYGHYTDEKAKEIAKELLAIARKQIAGELEEYKSEAPLGMMPDGWLVGVNDCISNIKEG